MSKFVFFNYGEGYQKCLINAIHEDAESFYFAPFRSRIVKVLFSIHNAWPINRKRERLFKRVWFKRVMRGVEINQNDDVFFLMYESFHFTYSKKFLKYLKNTYPYSKTCFIFSNPADEYNQGKLNTIRGLLDAVITFNKKDSVENGYLFNPTQPFKVPVYQFYGELQSDVFFIGAEKGRLEKLVEIYEYLSKNGIVCEFYIVGVSVEKQKHADKIHYNQRLSYDEVLRKVSSTKCVLEILQNSENYMSIRTKEAMQYHKKLITSNCSVKNYSFYNSDIIQVFEHATDIDISFINTDVNEKSFPDESFSSISSFKQYLQENV